MFTFFIYENSYNNVHNSRNIADNFVPLTFLFVSLILYFID